MRPAIQYRGRLEAKKQQSNWWSVFQQSKYEKHSLRRNMFDEEKTKCRKPNASGGVKRLELRGATKRSNE